MAEYMLQKVPTSVEECFRCCALSYDLNPDETSFEETVKHDLEFKMFYFQDIRCSILL